MRIWHPTDDTSRLPRRVRPGEFVTLTLGTWPLEPGQSIEVPYRVERAGRVDATDTVDAIWQNNAGMNSYWKATLGPFALGETITYAVIGRSHAGEAPGPSGRFRVGPALYLAMLWHQHQPVYKDTAHTQRGSYLRPWVRLHAIRDYYSMAALVAEHPSVHVTFNLTPCLIWQIEDYIERGATDRALDLTLTPAETLSNEAQEEILSSFFDADWHNQIFPHPRYKELFLQRRASQRFTTDDLRDLQMWFNLAWFGKDFREAAVELPTGEVASASRFAARGRGFDRTDVEAMVEEQFKIMRAIVPMHVQLQEQGQIEVCTTPFYHPILPLLVDTDQATIDRPGASHPPRFAARDDADAQVRLATEFHRRRFGRAPSGMWPAEGAVSQDVVPLFADHGARWIATDRGVLARSGRWGYETHKRDVLCQPYRAEQNSSTISVFFRDAELSDDIGFRYHAYADAGEAARDFIDRIKERVVPHLSSDEDRVLTIVLDGENAWGAYPNDGRPFLQAVYGLLEEDAEIQTTTFAEYVNGNAARGISAHPLAGQARVHDLCTGSWIDEYGSAPGADLGTWIGEDEENQAWELLARARGTIRETDATPQTAPAAFEALYIAEGSDWFWWFGDDQNSGNDPDFDYLFRVHLRNIYKNLGRRAPADLQRHIVPHTVVWSFTRPVKSVQAADRLMIQTHCPGVVSWRVDDTEAQTAQLTPAGSVMAGIRRHYLTLGPFPSHARELHFGFLCSHSACDARGSCCREDERVVRITGEYRDR